MAKSSNAAKPLSSICLSLLWLAVLKRPSRCGRGRKAGDVSDPPQKQGGHAASCSGILRHTSTRPHGVAPVLIYPCGKAQKQAPFPLALHRVESVLAVKGSLRRFAPWTAPGRSEKRAAYEGKGGERITQSLYLI